MNDLNAPLFEAGHFLMLLLFMFCYILLSGRTSPPLLHFFKQNRFRRMSVLSI